MRDYSEMLKKARRAAKHANKLEIDTANKMFKLNGKQLERVVGYTISDFPGNSNPTVSITIDCDAGISGTLIPSDAETVRCRRCRTILGYSIGGAFLKAYCDCCKSKTKVL